MNREKRTDWTIHALVAAAIIVATILKLTGML